MLGYGMHPPNPTYKISNSKQIMFRGSSHFACAFPIVDVITPVLFVLDQNKFLLTDDVYMCIHIAIVSVPAALVLTQLKLAEYLYSKQREPVPENTTVGPDHRPKGAEKWKNP